jgi:hypothetical protein
MIRRGGEESASLSAARYFFNRNGRQGFAKGAMVQSLLCFFSVHTVNSVVFYFSPQWSPSFRKGGKVYLFFTAEDTESTEGIIMREKDSNGF